VPGKSVAMSNGKKSQENQSEANSGAPQDSNEDHLAHRLDALGRKLDIRSDSRHGKKPADKPKTGYAQALRLSSDFIAGIVVGVALGWGFDKLFDTSPWGLIVFLFLGFGAGIMNVLRTAGVVTEPAVRKTQSGNGQKPDGPDDHKDGRGE